jgi:iron complex outermembrane receptor protein
MSRVLWAALLCTSVALSLIGATRAAHAQAIPIPEIVVTAPSPIQRPRTARAVATPAPAGGPATAAEPPPAAGTLPIVTDQFATVTVVPNEEIRRNGASTLGDLLFEKPGITGSSFAPGASSRPIIRGLDVNRVRIQENGIGANGASDLGEDHFVPVDPLSTNQVEVIRGPATLRYGSQAIGGVVEAINNRIPDRLPCGDVVAARPLPPVGANKAPPLTPVATDIKPCANVELRGALTSVDKGTNGGVLVDTGGGNFAFHADAFGRSAEDYRIPHYPYLVPPNPADAPRALQPNAFNGKQPNSALRTDGWSVGGSYVFQQGFAGVAVTQNNALYHIPGIGGDDHNTRINARHTKVMAKGEVRAPFGPVDAIRFWGGVTDYKHNEIGLANDTDLSSDGVRQTFTNKEQEGRIEAQFLPLNLLFASLTTAVGVQGGHQELTAPSPDDPGSPLNGLWDPNHNSRIAGYVFNEFKFSEMTKAQVAGRVEHVNLSGTVPSMIPGTFDLNTDPTAIGPATPRNLNFTPKSASAGLLQNLPWDLVGSATAQYVERAPKPAELFSRGGHDATATFDIGNPDLKTEVAKSVEVGVRRAAGPIRFEATAYYTRFDGFIFRRLTGNTCDGTACVAPDDPAGPLELRQAVYSQRDAIFRGGEFQSQWDLVAVGRGWFGIDDQFDVVRATFTDGTNVPRIPPVRVGGGLYYRDSNWFVRVNLLHAFAQNNIALVGETPTAGYNDLRAQITYTTILTPRDFGPREVTVGLVGTNLLNQDIRNSVSYTKDEVLMPGAGVRAFATIKF